MAKMTTVRPSVLALALTTALAAPTLIWAQTIPDAGIAAEARSDWPAAEAIYRAALAERPDDGPLWRRLAEVLAAAGDRPGAAQAYGEAARLADSDPALHFEHARALAMAGQLEAALDANGRALDRDPNNIDYLLARAQIGNWLGRDDISEPALQRVLELAPERTEVLAGIARNKAWSGQLDEAIVLMQTYHETHPDDRAAGLDLVRFHSWTGNYARTLDVLDQVEARSGVDDESRAVRAYVLAWAGRRHAALALNTPLLEQAPENYARNYTQAIALRQGQIPAHARPYVQQVERIDPQSTETRDLLRSTRVILASKLSGRFDYFEDSDDIRTLNSGIDGRWNLSDRLSLLGSLGERRVRAPIAGPFAPDSGGNSVRDRRVVLGVRHALDDDRAFTVQTGLSDLDTRGEKVVFRGEFDARMNDTFTFLVGLERDRVSASPRSLDREIMRTGGDATVRITPNVRHSIELTGRYADLNDDNDTTHIAGVWRRAMIRRPGLMLDAGLSGEWLHYRIDNDNGYYSPDNYRRIGGLVGAYLPLTDESGLSVQLGLGIQRDETFDHWERASDVAVEYTAGIFSDWQIKLRAGYVERVQNTGAFEGATFGVTLERRF